jgi:hypothetical protein
MRISANNYNNKMIEKQSELPLTAMLDDVNAEYRAFTLGTILELKERYTGTLYLVEQGTKTFISFGGRQVGYFEKVKRNGWIVYKFEENKISKKIL